MRLASHFRQHLSSARLAEAQASESAHVGLFPNLSVGFWNDAAEAFFRDNGGQGELVVGNGPVVDDFASAVRSFYTRLYQQVQDSETPADHDYDCSSPTVYRRFRLRVYPLPGRGLLLRHQKVVEHPHTAAPHPALEDRYRNAEGFVVQCCHCRCTRRADHPDTWDWVPELVAHMPEDTSHGLCMPCFRHYYPEAAATWRKR